ncbi:hypothetical protein BDV18DRAFT_67188 [Aspergillus unguis]
MNQANIDMLTRVLTWIRESPNSHSKKTKIGTPSPYGRSLDYNNPAETAMDPAHIIDEHDESDASTIYSDPDIIFELHAEGFCPEVADLIGNDIQEIASVTVPDRLLKILPDLLKSFALKLGSSESGRVGRELMVFVHRFRQSICAYLDGRLQLTKRPQTRQTPEIPRKDLVESWLQKLETDPSTAPGYTEQAQAPETMGEISPNVKYRDAMRGSPAYRWVLASIGREILLETADGRSTSYQRDSMLSQFQRCREVSSSTPPNSHTASVRMNWNLRQFIGDHKGRGIGGELFEQALTLTGSLSHAQALTCAEYMRQVWPLTTNDILGLLKELVGKPDPRRLKQWKRMYDGTELRLRDRAWGALVMVTGTTIAIAEIVEQFEWLGAALRCVNEQQALICCDPRVVRSRMTRTTDNEREYSFTIDFQTTGIGKDVPLLPGSCWLDLFTSSAIVSGYPVLKRAVPDSGLEASLSSLAALVRADRVSVFAGKVYLKGFAGALVPTSTVAGDTVIWHALTNKDESYMSYADIRIQKLQRLDPKSLQLSRLEDCRHIVGWCSDAVSYVGSVEASYNTEWSGLPKAPAGSDFANVHIYRGMLLSQTTKIVFPIQNTPKASNFDDYAFKIMWITRKLFVLYGVDDKRGWLVDGASALLHLVRASLKHEESGPFHDSLSFAWANAKEYSTARSSAKAAAVAFLMSESNKNCKIYKTSSLTNRPEYALKDRVEDILSTLEQIIDYRELIGIREKTGLNSKATLSNLEGFDFMDVATLEDEFPARYTHITPGCDAWIEMTKSIHAPVLFGYGYGDLVQPRGPEVACPAWESVPTDSDYLTVCAEDLREIMRRKGNMRSQPWRVVDDLTWHSPGKTTEQCECEGVSTDKCDRVQLLIPGSMIKNQMISSPLSMASRGAFIFAGSTYDSPVIEQHVRDGRHLPLLGAASSPNGHSKDQGPYCGSSPPSSAYTVGWICAIKAEIDESLKMLDENRGLRHGPGDRLYTLGRIGAHNVVMTCLSRGRYGNEAAAVAATNMMRLYPGIKIGFMVGIAGGIPSKHHDIRLGDVVVGVPKGQSGGVRQYNMGKYTTVGFEPTGYLRPPPDLLLNALNYMPENGPFITDCAVLNDMFTAYPGEVADVLYDCDRPARRKAGGRGISGPHVFYGTIASGNTVIKDSSIRDRLREWTDCLCVEMEGAGLMSSDFPGLVIRGISDYADHHKNDGWQPYAALSAASYARYLLMKIPSLVIDEQVAV